MKSRPVLRLAGAVLAAAFCVSAQAQVVYKLVDKNGKVTYSETAPKDFAGKVIKLEFDPNANTATLAKPAASTGETAGSRGESKRRSAQQEAIARLNAAQERLEAAKKALQEARDNPAEGDILMVGKVGGGVRHINSEPYQQKLDKLAQDLKDAEDELRRAERGV
jgi:hypothetical protein